MNDTTEIRKTLRSFILENYLFTTDESALANNASFLDTKILDSMGILEVIHFLDEQFSVKVHESEMIPANLDSIDNLTAFVASKNK